MTLPPRITELTAQDCPRCPDRIHVSGCPVFAAIQAIYATHSRSMFPSEHEAAIKTVEWAYGVRQVTRDSIWVECRACQTALHAQYRPDLPDWWQDSIRAIHAPDCPIPALGFAILRQEHWYERRWG